MNEVIFKDLIVFHIQKNTLKNIYIKIHKDSKVIIKTPPISKKYLQKILIKKELWIRKQLFKQKNIITVEVNLEDEVLLFDEVYSIDSDKAEILRNLLFKLKNPSKESVVKCYDKFYKQYSSIYLTQKLEEYSKIMNLSYSSLKFRKMKSMWGSCNSRGVITLNTQLLKLKKELIDYVLVHELAHLVYMNHSKQFHSFVDVYLPNSKLLRKNLRKHRILE